MTNVTPQASPQDHTESEEKPDAPTIIRDEGGRFSKGTRVAGTFVPPQASPQDHEESPENKKITVATCENCGEAYDASNWDKGANGGVGRKLKNVIEEAEGKEKSRLIPP